MCGWQEFVSDISLEDGHILAFDYDGKITFKFIHFGHSLCEQKIAQPRNSRVNAKKSKLKDQDNFKYDEKEGEDDNDDEEDDDDTYEDNGDENKDDDNNEEEDDEQTYDNNEEDDNENTYDDNDDDKDEEEEEGEDEGGENDERLKELVVTTSCKTNERKSLRLSKKKHGSTTVSKNGKVITRSDIIVLKKEKESSSSEIYELESEETIFKHGIVMRPKNPYFVTRIRLKRRNQLHIPADLIRHYDIKLPPTLMLLDQEGRRNYVKVATWKDGRTWLTRGWKYFVKINNLTEKDRCICEFVINNGNEDSEVYMNMIVLPAGSWLPK
ncbi:B3 domain-containing protein At5g60140-like [Impatiens glandulifera]|uniref:B3 domain-containing protein At5g60140-like n=1 Tax=Impatiens glandulifera TaxID=253017 RepID=UPI001FB164E5|nr:B3 domain-containing protein At5g60140-like [Impatiens glandulifera]